MRAICENIRKYRKLRKMSQATLAEILEVSAQSVSKWENDMTLPEVTKLAAICDALKITINDLLSMPCSTDSIAYANNEKPDAVMTEIYKIMLGKMAQSPEGMAERMKFLCERPSDHAGLVSPTKRGSIYMDKRMALAYACDITESYELLESPDVEKVLDTLSDPIVRRIIKYQLTIGKINFTAEAVSVLCQIDIDKVNESVLKLIDLGITSETEVDDGTQNPLKVYSPVISHKVWLMIIPLLSLAERLANYEDNWDYLSY